MSFEHTYLLDLVKKKANLSDSLQELTQRVSELESAKAKMSQGLSIMLEGLKMAYKDIDLNDENIKDTPSRMARAFIEVCSGLGVAEEEIFSTTFPAPGSQEAIILTNIEYTSICSHHFFPFYGHAHVGYVPNHSGKVLGLSKLARVVDAYANRPQLQERMGHQIMESINRNLNPHGVIVILEGKHGCLNCRGAKKKNSVMKTICTKGVYSENKILRDEFIQFTQIKESIR